MSNTYKIIFRIFLLLNFLPLSIQAEGIVLNNPTGSGAVTEHNSYAKALDILDVFTGTNQGYELERIPTRAEVLVMTIRLSGKEQETLLNSDTHPFLDTTWEDAYVSYGYHHAMVKGVSEKRFGGNEDSSLKQYCALLLRLLGYTEQAEDFTYENAISFASLVLGEVISNEMGFNRGKMAELSCYALNTRRKNSSLTLGQTLIKEGVFSSQQLIEAQKCWEQETEYESTTVLIYTIGSDLESKQGRLSNDLKEILRGEPKNNCKVLIQTGGTLTYHNDEMENGKAQRFLVEGDKLLLKDEEINTPATHPETLENFIKWGSKEAPAKRYILVLWDHGYGIKGGFGADELNNRRTMKISDLSSAIEKANVFFDIIAFDACLMGTAEIAYALKGHTKYLIASEDSTPACGLYYTTWIGALERNPAISTRRIGRVILDSFTLHAGIEANIPTTLSIMKVSRAEALIDAIAKFEGNAKLKADALKLLGENEGILDQFDLLSVMKEVPQITAAAQALAFEVRNAPEDKNYSGVAIYVPSRKIEDASAIREEFIKLKLPDQYLEVIFKGIALK